MFRSSLLTDASSFEAGALETCEACPRLCRHACPVAEAEGRESTSPHALVFLSGLLQRRGVDSAETGGLTYHCSHCGACTSACLHANDVPRVLTLARHRLLIEGTASPAVKELCANFAVSGNPQGGSLSGVLQDVARAAGLNVVGEARTVYLPGCSTLELAPESAANFLRAASLLGAKSVTLTKSSDLCCGLPLYWAGDLEGFQQHARRFATNFREVETLVVHDPACASALRHRYPEVGVSPRFEVKHVTTVLAEALGRDLGTVGSGGGPRLSDLASPTRHGRLAYADSCSLARGLGLVAEPREILQHLQGTLPAEVPPSGREVDCCGAAGLLRLTAPETADAMGLRRLAAFRETGADQLVLASPRCAAHLARLDPEAKIVDLTALLARL